MGLQRLPMSRNQLNQLSTSTAATSRSARRRKRCRAALFDHEHPVHQGVEHEDEEQDHYQCQYGVGEEHADPLRFPFGQPDKGTREESQRQQQQAHGAETGKEARQGQGTFRDD